MAANKFATIVINNSNKITLVLIYAVLEWALIILLLLNSIFSYFIIKFARFFGLKPPCLWCVRLDRFFEHENKNSHRDLLCELHSKEVSQLGFCLKHRKLAESHDMCEDCAHGFGEKSKNLGFSEVKKIDFVESDGSDEVIVKCSCCGVEFERKCFDDSSCFVINPSWDFLGFSKKRNSIVNLIGSDLENDDFEGKQKLEIQGKETEETGETEIESIREDLIQFEKMEVSNAQTNPQDLEFFLDFSGNHLVPIELIEPTMEQIRTNSEVEDQEFGDFQKAQVMSESEIEIVTEEFVKETLEKVSVLQNVAGELLSVTEKTEETGETEIESIKEDLIQFEKREVSNSQTNPQDLEFFLDFSGNHLVPIELIEPTMEQIRTNSEVEDQEFGDFQKAQVMSESKIETVTEELVKETLETVSVLQNVAEELLSVTEKTEELSKFAELDSMEFEETENSLVFHANSSAFSDEKPAISEPNRTPSDNEELQEIEENYSGNEGADVSIGTEIPVLDSCDEIKAQDNFTLYSLSHEEPSTSSHDLDFNLEYGFEETREHEKIGELMNLNHIDDRMLMIERKESMVEESFDESEIDGGDPINTTEKLKSALRADRTALQALYIELEEERNASAVAASETMAMINRLQEEKAAMQMEALHYQRMMEEQSEYDQEALQLLNDLMIKKEKELEMYRKKVLEFETKERMRFLASSVKSGTCSASCSHSEDGDGMWVDLNHEPKENEISNGNRESQHQNTPVDTILNLDSSFVDFEDERLSILDQLKVLEKKLFTLSDEEDRYFGDVRPIEDYFEENGKHLNENYGYDDQEVNGITNGFQKEAHETHYQDRRSIGSTGKRLLPLFDALETESDDGVVVSNGHENGFHADKLEDTAVTRFELQKKRIDMEEEVDQLYVRLQALEADREFLKHCIGSLKKGDKGMELLKEILQHLRDLRSVDLRAKSFTDGTLI